MAKAKVLPSTTLYKQFEERMAAGGMDLGDVVKLGARYLVQCAVELEVREGLGREYYQHGAESSEPGRRSGYLTRKIQTGEGSPEAMKILGEDLEACLTVLKLPLKLRRVVRTTNLLERLFGENRRRTKVIPHFFEETAAMKLIYATLVAASTKWRGIEIDTSLYALLSSLREDLPKEEYRLKEIA